MGVNVTRVVKFIRKGDKGSDAVRYWLIPSVSSVSMSDVEGGDGHPTPSSVSCRLVKQVGDDTPTTIANASSVGLTMTYALIRTVVKTLPATYNGGNITVPTNTDYRAIEFYLHRGNLLIDTATVAIVCDGEPGEPGKPGTDGEDAISIKVSPQTMVLKRNGKVQPNIRVYVDLFKGETQIPYGDDTQGNMLCSTLTGSGRKITDGLTWGLNTDNGRFYYYFTYSGTTDINTEIPFTVTYNGKSYPEKIIVKTVADGDRGPTLRGPQAWSDCATSYGFQCGAEGEAWKDVVLYGNNYYSCIKSHAKTASNYPGSTADQTNHYWQLGDKIELVATKILLASYALVKNLGVECIDMRDAAGNILFQAKGGNVTCKTGTFDGITVRNAEIESGHIAGFKVSGTGLTNDPFTNDAYIIFRNDAHNCFAGIGGNVLPTTSGARAVARFENDDTKDQWGLGRNIALLLSAKNGQYNHAFYGAGNGTLDGWIGGHKFSKYALAASNTIYNGFVNLRENNKWVIYAASTVTGSGIVLPTLYEVQSALGIGTNKAFCVEFTILADLHTHNFYVYGRNKLKDSSNATPWDTEQIPVLAHWNNGRDDRITMGAGDCMTVLLIYDPNKPGVLNDFSLKYTARRIYHTS